MENTVAVNGIQQILSKLEDEELLALAATVTQGLLRNKLETRKGAIEAILKYSPDIQSILKRKIVTRDILFTYLHESNVSVALPATKNDLIDIICTHWNLKPTQYVATTTQRDNVNYNNPTNGQYKNLDTSEINTMALKFSEWFYTMMNANEPIGPEHFWRDAKLKMNLTSGSDTINHNVEDSAEEIVQILYKTKYEHQLYFNPNFLSDGVQGRRDPHGLVMVLACGTLHSNNLCVGVFEQVFVLARDPFVDNNWKIKSTELNLKSKKDVKAPPSLCDSSLTSNLLSLPGCSN